MEYLALALTLFGLIVIIMLKGLYDDRKRKKEFNLWLRENYGVLPEREEYRPEEFVRIAGYYKAHEEDGFCIDDITWNDLGMDNIFKQMNYTYSAAGEEYLYYLLRTPMQDIGKAALLERHIGYFMDNKESRVKYQTLFAQMGKTGKYSIYDYLGYLNLLGERDNKKYYLGNLIILFAAVIMFFSVQLGILLLIAAICRNIIGYFKDKKEIDPYITSFGYILRLIRSAQELERFPAEAFSQELEELRECIKKMGKFKTGSYIIMSPSRMNAASNPLEILLDYFRMVFHLDLIKFNKMLSEVRGNRDIIDRMITITGYMEAVIAIGAYRAARESYCIPEFDSGDELRIENMYHPLIQDPVKNSITAKKGVLLTGSNASGKSTFLKTVAINAILAQTIHTCPADSYRGGLYRIMSSMALRDDLEGGDSYYIVEIKSLKRILSNVSGSGNKVLCFVDEVLRGTNTVERIAASAQILRSLAGSGVICFAATHDIELTHLLEKAYDNYHFEEEVIDDDIVFNYRLLEGRAATRNAIKLLGVMGYDETIIQKAEMLAQEFLEKGTWTAEEPDTSFIQREMNKKDVKI